jgi:hypothetical protein
MDTVIKVRGGCLINQAPTKNYTIKWEGKSNPCMKILHPSVEKEFGLKESNI